MEDKERELQHNVGEENTEKITENTEATPSTEASETVEIPEKEPSGTLEEKGTQNEAETTEAAEPKESIPSKSEEEKEPVATESKKEETAANEDDAVLEEIDESNAEDAEDTGNNERHTIPVLDYHSMSMENLVGELQKLVRNEKVQAIKKQVDGIKSEFDLKFQEFLEEKKEDFINGGGNEIDFRYNSVTKRQFNEVYDDYREKRNIYYKSLEKNLKENLSRRLEIIEELKGLVNVDEDMNTTYKAFKELQESWRNAGPIPRTDYNNVWRTYQHHIEIFYDFLHLNRELRDLDFKHNLEEKEKLVVQAEILTKEPDLTIAFRDLQTLHKIWKEDIGPVGQEHREEIWERFSNATKVLHQRRQDHYKELDAEYEKNLVVKNEIIAAIEAMSQNVATSHKALQQQIKKLEELRNAFFGAGKVPRNQNEKTWDAFKGAVRNFNKSKNAYYKNLKKEQQDNLDKKRALLDRAVALKESEEWDRATPEMKRIQNDWKQIGHVPRKYSDKIWKEFKTACNHYFDRMHAVKNEGLKDEQENFEKKSACLDKLAAFELSGKREDDLTSIKAFIAEWKTYGRVPFKKKNIDQKFNKILDGIFKKLDIDRQESELLKYGNKIQELAKADNERAIQNERSFIRKKIEESKGEIRQLETNLEFFSNASEDNPLVRDVIKRVESHKETLETWKAKLKKLNILKNDIIRAHDAEEEAASAESEAEAEEQE